MIQAGQTPPKSIIADGIIHRYPVENGTGRVHGKSGWYCFHTDGPVPVGFFGDWRKGTSVKWVSDEYSNLGYLDQMQATAFMAQAEINRKNQQDAEYARAAESAKEIYAASKTPSEHAYLIKKNITAYPGVKQAGNSLVIPVLSESFQVQSLQYIRPSGDKKNLPKGKMKGGFFIIQGSSTILICEGYATGATLHRCTGHSVYCAFSAGNILAVAQFVKSKNLESTIIICGDNDIKKHDNIGASKATIAGEVISAKVFLPETSGSDFNDLANESGDNAVLKMFVEPKKQTIIHPKTDKIPEHLLNPGGLIQDMMNSIEKCSAASVPFFSLGAAFATIGSVLGQKVMTETGLRTNFYIMSLGYSGTGKSGVMSYLQNMISLSHASKILAPSEFTSPTAILQSLVASPVSIFYVDEVGAVLAGLKNPSSPEAGIPRMMTKLFTSTDRAESKGYANTQNNIMLPYHHMSFYGASPPEAFWDAMSNGQVSSGFLARQIIFEDQTDAPLPHYKKDFSHPVEIIAAINALCAIEPKIDRSSGDNPQFHKPIPYIIPKTKQAQSFFDGWALEYHNLKNKHKRNTTGISSIYARAAEHASKTSLVKAFSDGGPNTHEVPLPVVEYCCSMMDFIISNVIRQVEDNVSDSDVSRYKNKILKGIKAYSEKNIKKYGVQGATIRDIQRGPGQGLVSKNLKDILDSMVVAERIMFKPFTTTSGQVTGFYYVPE